MTFRRSVTVRSTRRSRNSRRQAPGPVFGSGRRPTPPRPRRPHALIGGGADVAGLDRIPTRRLCHHPGPTCVRANVSHVRSAPSRAQPPGASLRNKWALARRCNVTQPHWHTSPPAHPLLMRRLNHSRASPGSTFTGPELSPAGARRELASRARCRGPAGPVRAHSRLRRSTGHP